MTDSMGGLNHIGEQTLSVTGTSGGLTLPTGATVSRPKHASFRVVSGSPVRWRADGTDPTTTAGSLLNIGDVMEWLEPLWDYYGMISRVEFISTTGSTATVEVTYFD